MEQAFYVESLYVEIKDSTYVIRAQTIRRKIALANGCLAPVPIKSFPYNNESDNGSYLATDGQKKKFIHGIRRGPHAVYKARYEIIGRWFITTITESKFRRATG